jgi:hypothetical protein
MTHLDIWNTSYGQKKGWESNGQFDFQPLKVRNLPDSFECRWGATYHWKALDKGLQLCFKLHLNRRSVHKIMGPKVVEVLTLGILGFPFGSPGTKCHFDLGLVAKHKLYYKGEGGEFP